MWIHISSHETAWGILKTRKKRSRKQGKGNLRGRNSCRFWSNSESAKEIMIRKMYIPRWAILVLTGHDPTWNKHGSCRNILQENHICVRKPTRNWFQEIFLQAIAGNNCSTGQLLPRLLWVRFCGFVFAFAFNFRPANTNTNGLVLPSMLFLV